MNKKNCLFAILLACIAGVGVSYAAGQPKPLTPEQINLIESGGGTLGEKSQYISDCYLDQVCFMALVQIWEKNGGDVDMSHYKPDREKINRLFRGTDFEKKAIEGGALTICFQKNDGCVPFLVEATKTIRSMPPEELNRVYQAKAQEEWDRSTKNVNKQVEQKITNAVANINDPSQQTTNQNSAQSAATVISENDLAIKLNAFPPRTDNLIIEDRKDGFIVNGQTFVDAEGRIISYAFDILTGDVTYLAQTGGQNFVIKYARASSNQEGLPIANATRSNSGWQVQTVTGKKFNGDFVTMLSRGFLITRDSAVFLYQPGVGTKNIAVNNGYSIVPLQRGDAGTTSNILLEKIPENPNSAGGLFGSLKSLGSSIGLSRADDYAVLNITNGKLFPINIDASNKNVASYSDCRKRNNFFNECANMTTRESLYARDGSRNKGHYYWRANWFNTPSGTILIALENGVKDVTITNLTTGKKAAAFSRAMGIVGFDAYQLPDGKIKIVANWAFQDHQIDDAVAFLETAPAIDNDAKSAKTDNSTTSTQATHTQPVE